MLIIAIICFTVSFDFVCCVCPTFSWCVNAFNWA